MVFDVVFNQSVIRDLLASYSKYWLVTRISEYIKGGTPSFVKTLQKNVIFANFTELSTLMS